MSFPVSSRISDIDPVTYPGAIPRRGVFRAAKIRPGFLLVGKEKRGFPFFADR